MNAVKNVKTVASADGSAIAFETTGAGPPLILVGGAFNDRSGRAAGTPLAALLAARFTVFCYDRRGRGDSGDTAPYAPDREIEDLAAVIEAAGGTASVYGHSSGGVLALAGAIRQLPIAKLALYEPPLLDAERATPSLAMAQQLDETVAAGRRAEAAELFLTRGMQMPAPAVAQMRASPMWRSLESLAHTLSYDVRLSALGPSLLAKASTVRATTLTLHGDACPPWMRAGLQALTSAIPGAHLRVLSGQSHNVDLAVMAGALGEFFAG